MQTPPFSAMFDQWQNYQKSYMDAWQSIAESSFAGKQPGNPWTEALDKWWKGLSNQAPPESRDLFSLLVDQGKTFFDMASAIKGSMHEAMQVKSNGGDWEKVIRQTFDGLRSTLAVGTTSFPMELWHKFVIERFQSPGDLIPDVIKQFLGTEKQILSTPGIGLSREKQQQLQKLAEQATQYQIACGEFIEVQTKIVNLAIDLLQKEICEKFSCSQYPESCRAVYDLWVDCYEEVYADAVMQPEYNTAYSDMVNSLMSLTLTYRELQDDTLEACGMPSRRELDTLHQRFQEERREKYKMRADIESLREQVKQLAENTRPAPEPKAEKPVVPETKPASPAVPRRTATRRRTPAAAKSTTPPSTK
ncbi:MAG: class III poly(R)-hydroxyalkanoic acid synthase subunit PhaE [Methylococcaceae bacterium]|nr:class III poly(R)-hydroxyalkanoic acid synthase subunit PhaE [Methylococcaceae bacterium]MCI0734626.1 class III poly(R)-hydroxyalkanoic acid synthase subunit PhaE [Methylococcaceae bacterium]